MNKPEHVLLVIAIAAFLSGLMSGATLGGLKASRTPGLANASSYQDGWNAAKKRLQEGGFYGALLPGIEIRSVSGQVQAVKSGQLTIKIAPLEPLADPDLDIRTVILAPDAKVILNKPKDQAVFRKEKEEFDEKMRTAVPLAPSADDPASPAEPIMPPSSFIEEEASLSAIKAGDRVTVEADKDIKNAKAFVAARIRVMGQPAMPEGEIAPVPPGPAMVE